MNAQNSETRAAPGQVQVAEAPWRQRSDIVDEVEQLRQQYSADGLCVADALCDDHPAENTAFITIDDEFNIERLNFGVLKDQSKRLAAGLSQRGVSIGTRVGVLMGKSRQLPIVLLALWRLGAVHVPLFTAFAGEAIATRVNSANAALIIADQDQQQKLETIALPVLTTGTDIAELIDRHEPLGQSVSIGPGGTFIQLYTSGTTDAPKGVPVPAFGIAAFVAYMRYGLDLREDDLFWNLADPGWAYGLYFGIVGPLAMGHHNILLSGAFSAERTARVLRDLGVTNLTGSPTVFRAMKKEGVHQGQPLRVISSAGEPLTPDVVEWTPEALGSEVRDHWGQTEQGMAIVNPWEPRLRGIVPEGSMGQAMPGFLAGTIDEVIALSVDDSPLMWFTEYMDAPEQTQKRYSEDGKWYLTGDIGRAEGANLFFASRDDDVMLAAGYRIAPFDIERIISGDASVAEVAVVGRPDEIRGEVIEAFVVLSDDASPEGLTERLQQAVRDTYGAHAYPRRIHVVPRLPKTPSGKVQRYVLREADNAAIAEMTES